jgi:hypothetical protein
MSTERLLGREYYRVDTAGPAGLTGVLPSLTVDNINFAQLINLLLNNKNLREVIDTVTSKALLILGRFDPEKKKVLYAIPTCSDKNMDCCRSCSILRPQPSGISRDSPTPGEHVSICDRRPY